LQVLDPAEAPDEQSRVEYAPEMVREHAVI